jgi:prepilin-type N-terminal cleavage/methylation domain
VRKAPRGFTLVEFTLVAIIVALLATMFIPAATGAYRLSYSGSCQQRMRQIPFAMQMYANEHGGVFPKVSSPGDMLMPWLRNPAVLRCPAPDLRPELRPYRLHSGFAADEPCNLVVVAESHRDGHRGGANYAFLDGHVKWFAPAAAPALGRLMDDGR